MSEKGQRPTLEWGSEGALTNSRERFRASWAGYCSGVQCAHGLSFMGRPLGARIRRGIVAPSSGSEIGAAAMRGEVPHGAALPGSRRLGCRTQRPPQWQVPIAWGPIHGPDLARGAGPLSGGRTPRGLGAMGQASRARHGFGGVRGVDPVRVTPGLLEIRRDLGRRVSLGPRAVRVGCRRGRAPVS